MDISSLLSANPLRGHTDVTEAEETAEQTMTSACIVCKGP